MNELLHIPNCFQNLICLTDLSLKKNKLVDIAPDAFDGLERLINLDLTNNKLTKFVSVPRSTSLDSLILAYN